MGGPVQVDYEALRANALGDRGAVAGDAAMHDRCQRYGMVGLFRDEDIAADLDHPPRRVELCGAPESAAGWRTLVEVYRALIEKSLNPLPQGRIDDETSPTPRVDLRASLVSPTAEGGHDRKSAH